MGRVCVSGAPGSAAQAHSLPEDFWGTWGPGQQRKRLLNFPSAGGRVRKAVNKPGLCKIAKTLFVTMCRHLCSFRNFNIGK